MEQENFESLRRMLALKRHEQPPPGYFHTLSAKICARIESREQLEKPSFFSRFFADGIKPALAYSFVFSVCALMAYGLNSFFRLEPEPTLSERASDDKTKSVALDQEPRDYQSAAPWLASTVQVSSNAPSVFGERPSSLMPLPMATKASFNY